MIKVPKIMIKANIFPAILLLTIPFNLFFIVLEKKAIAFTGWGNQFGSPNKISRRKPVVITTGIDKIKYFRFNIIYLVFSYYLNRIFPRHRTSLLLSFIDFTAILK